MDCCATKKDDKKDGPTDVKNVKPEGDGHESHAGGCCGNPWVMVAVIIVFAVILYITRS